METFKEYLREFHCAIYAEISDDSLPDSFDNWLSGVDTDRLIRYADLYGKELVIKTKEELLR